MGSVKKILCVYLFWCGSRNSITFAPLPKKINMLKTRLLLLLLLCAGTAANAQTDSTAKKDTLIEEVRDGVVDNIPIVSLDENDLGDGASGNTSSLLTAGRDPFYSAASFNWSAL